VDQDGHLTIAVRAPLAYLRNIGTPTELMYGFLEALRMRGIAFEDTREVRTRIDKNKGTFLIRWTGHVLQNVELVYNVLPELTQGLGARSFGELT
jgi:hypothetical protein